jgi:hypothetical protein
MVNRGSVSKVEAAWPLALIAISYLLFALLDNRRRAIAHEDNSSLVI